MPAWLSGNFFQRRKQVIPAVPLRELNGPALEADETFVKACAEVRRDRRLLDHALAIREQICL